MATSKNNRKQVIKSISSSDKEMCDRHFKNYTQLHKQLAGIYVILHLQIHVLDKRRMGDENEHSKMKACLDKALFSVIESMQMLNMNLIKKIESYFRMEYKLKFQGYDINNIPDNNTLTDYYFIIEHIMRQVGSDFTQS